MPALRLTAYKTIIDLLKEYKIYNRVKHNKSSNTLEYKNNFMSFLSVDDPDKIKSTEWNYEWLEEANQFTYQDFIILSTRLSGKTTKGCPNRMFISINTDDENGWINTKIILDPNNAYHKNSIVIHSTYKDNPFLEKEYINDLENLKISDPRYWKIFGLGLWGKLDTIIYNPFLMKQWPGSFDETIYGLDFGFNNQTALLEINEKDQEFFFREKIYETKLTNMDLIVKLKIIIPEDIRHRSIYADNAEPARIEEIRQAGFNIFPADKRVKDGIDFCKAQKIYTLAENVNLNEERNKYGYKKDKNDNVSDDPVKFKDHLMDAMRYGVYTYYKDKNYGAGMTIIG